jgi:hypothetical protein
MTTKKKKKKSTFFFFFQVWTRTLINISDFDHIVLLVKLQYLYLI